MPDGLCQFESLSRFARLACREARRGRTCTKHLDRLNMGSTERGDSILGSKLCSFTTSPLCLPEAAAVKLLLLVVVVVVVETTLCVTCRNKRRASCSLFLCLSLSLSLSLCLFALFLRRLSNGDAFLFLLHRLSLEHWWLSKRKLNEQPCQRDSISSNDAAIMLFPSEITLPETDDKDGGDNRWFFFFFE